MFNNKKSKTLCTFGELYISGLKNVRRDLLEKFHDMRESIIFDHKEINYPEFSWFNVDS